LGPPLSKPVELNDLEASLARDFQIGVNHEIFRELQSAAGVPIDNEFYALNPSTCMRGLRVPLAHVLSRGIRWRQSKAAIHGRVDALFITPLDECLKFRGCNFDFARNPAEPIKISSTTTPSSLPDISISHEDQMVMRGEEKAYTWDLPRALNELTEKFPRWYSIALGRLPYIFAFGVGWTDFQLAVLYPIPSGSNLAPKVGMQTLGKRIDFSTVTGRIELMRCAMNVARLLVPLSKVERPKTILPWDKWVERPNNAQIMLTRDFIVKTIENDGDPRYQYDFDALRALYRAIHDGRIANTVKLQVGNNGQIRFGDHVSTLVLKLVPVAREASLESPKDVMECLRCVLTALRDMHACGFLHRDARLANIMRLEESESYVLIDLEYATTIGSNSARSLKEEGKPWTVKDDTQLAVTSIFDAIKGKLWYQSNDTLKGLFDSLKQAATAGDALQRVETARMVVNPVVHNAVADVVANRSATTIVDNDNDDDDDE